MLRVYNTLSKSKESFTPNKKGIAEMYNCGPTVYSRLTIGNLRTYVFSDTLRRTLQYLGFKVIQIMNITDVGHLTMTEEQKKEQQDVEITDSEEGVDRMEKAARRENKTVWEVAEYYTQLCMDDFSALNLLKAKIYCRATQHIPEQIAMIQKLMDKGYAYVTKTAVYFDTSKFPDYGQLAHQNVEDKLTAVRKNVEKDDTKRHPADFRLWQLNQPDHAMQWDSPWGRGFPGWHIECSAMSLKYLSQPIDFHTGGTDHIPVHHTNEIAQSEAATGKKFVNYWMHGAFLMVDGKRMGKSLGNAYTLDDIRDKGFDPLDLRYFYLTAHYRQIENFTWEAMEASRSRRLKIQSEVDRWSSESSGVQGSILKPLQEQFKEAIEDDLNLPKAQAVVSALLDLDASPADKLATIADFDTVLGLKLLEQSKLTDPDQEEIQALLLHRDQLRADKQWAKADELRQQAEAKYKIKVEDSDKGSIWRRV